MVINKIYNDCFTSGNWELLNSKPAELISPRDIDFSIEDPQPAQNYLRTTLKIILLPWLAYEGVKWVAQRLIMARIYPAQSTLVKAMIPEFRTPFLDQARVKDAQDLMAKGFIVRHVTFERNGVKISGVLIGHRDHINNGKWALQATGNIQPVELGITMIGEIYHSQKYNVLMLNNPGIGRSEGTATPETIGATQEMGIQFLETVLKAKKVILAGYSMGGGAMSQAILKHAFRQDISYAALRQMSFDRVSNVCHKVLGLSWAPALVHWAGCEIDSLQASRRLQELKIPEVVIQSCDTRDVAMHDGAIPPDASLHYGILNELNVDETKQFINVHYAHHTDDRIKHATAQFLRSWEEAPSWLAKLKTPFTYLYDQCVRAPLLA